MSDDSMPITPDDRRKAAFVEKLLIEAEEDRIREELTPAQVEAALREQGMDPSQLTPAKALARVRARIRARGGDTRGVDMSLESLLGGRDYTIVERGLRWVELEDAGNREQAAEFAKMTPEQVAERARSMGIDPSWLPVDELLARARAKAR